MRLTVLRTPCPPFGRKKRRRRLVSSLVVEDGGRTILLDTGAPGLADLARELEKLDLRFADFDVVVNTHAHIDHAGHNCECTGAGIFISRADYEHERAWGEKALATGEYYFDDDDSPEGARPPVAVEMAEFHRRWWTVEMYGAAGQITLCDLPCSPAPGVELVPTPGHTPGHASVILTGASRRALFAGDAVPTRKHFRGSVGAHTVCVDRERFEESLARCREFRGIVIPGHDGPFDAKTGRAMRLHRVAI